MADSFQCMTKPTTIKKKKKLSPCNSPQWKNKENTRWSSQRCRKSIWQNSTPTHDKNSQIGT